MNQIPESIYVISLEEILWGGFLMAITMGIHGYGMLAVLRVINFITAKIQSWRGVIVRMIPVILASCMILFVHLIEVMVWAIFFLSRGAFPNRSVAFYFSLNEYTTLGSAFNLPLHWRLLEGMIATAGMLCFAWSTGILITLAQRFQEQQMEFYKSRKHRNQSEKNLSHGNKTNSANS
jgi:hypothetical protein